MLPLKRKRLYKCCQRNCNTCVKYASDNSFPYRFASSDRFCNRADETNNKKSSRLCRVETHWVVPVKFKRHKTRTHSFQKERPPKLARLPSTIQRSREVVRLEVQDCRIRRRVFRKLHVRSIDGGFSKVYRSDVIYKGKKLELILFFVNTAK